MGNIFNLIFYQPLFNLLVVLYNTVALGDLGLAIIFLTVLVRLILYPLFAKSISHQLTMQRLQPEIEKIKERYHSDRKKQTEETMAVYRANKINPFSGFLFIIIQLPILIALYRIFSERLTPQVLGGLYSFVAAPPEIKPTFFGLINLEQPSILLAGLAALLQYFQAKMGLKSYKGQGGSRAEKVGRQMAWIGLGITFAFLSYLPAAVGIYWTTTTLASLVQQFAIERKKRHGNPGTIHPEARRTDGLS